MNNKERHTTSYHNWYMMKKHMGKRSHKKRKLSAHDISLFRNKVYGYYKKYGRHLPWRKTQDPYHILVSEVMLQQTQVERVIPKYHEFIRHLPDVQSLASVSLKRLLRLWQGLGYNRRAIYLQKLARMVITEYGGKIPSTLHGLSKLPGIGKTTASAILAFAFNIPTVFIETNIRSVFIHHFFPKQKYVHDKEILPVVEQTLDSKNPRQWYNALMDYGTMLKQTVKNPGRKSAHYQLQSPFRHSDRKIRGLVIRFLLSKAPRSMEEIVHMTGEKRERIERIVKQLENEGLVKKQQKDYVIPS